MGLLTVILMAVVATAVFLYLQKRKGYQPSVSIIKEIGIFGLVIGIFAQLLGLYEAFSAIEQIGSVSPALLIGGFKISSITTLYGLIIFLLAGLLYFGLKMVDGKEVE